MISNAEIRTILERHFSRRSEAESGASDEEWDRVQEYFSCQFPESFRLFMTIVTEYYFEGGLLSVASDGEIEGEDTLITTVELEREMGNWPIDAVPFYDVGNGDYYCLNGNEGPNSRVYYVYHEDRRVEIVKASFDDWIRGMPDY